MNRPLVFICVSFIVGIIVSECLKSIIISILLTITILVVGLYYFNRRKVLIILSIAALALITGSIYTTYKGSISQSEIASFQEQNVSIEGTFIEGTTKDGNYVFFMNVSKINKTLIKSEKTRVKYYISTEQPPKFRYGDLILITGKVTLPDGQRNPGGFNYRRYLLTQNIYTAIYAKQVTSKAAEGGDYNSFVKLSLEMKDRLVEVIQESLPDKEAALLEGIVLSKTDLLDETIKENFQDSGLSHLMAVSGMNVAFLVLPLILVFKKFKINELVSNIAITLILIAFIIITGSSPSVIRAVIMSLVIMYGNLINRQSDAITSLAFSAALLLIYNPFIVFDIGFQLSYLATLSIITLYDIIKSKLESLPKVIAETAAVTLSAQLGVIPIIAYYFNKISLVSFISNMLAAPLSGVLLIIGLIMTLLGQIHLFLSKIFSGMVYVLINILMAIAEKSSNIPFSTITIPTPSIFAILIYYFAIVLIINYQLLQQAYIGMKNRYQMKTFLKAGIVCSIVLIICTCIYKTPLQISFMDVGQGDSIFIKTPLNKTVLIDCGGYSSFNSDIGENTIVPFLLDKGIRKIDIIILSHPDSDHISGLSSITETFKVDRLILSDSALLSNKLSDMLHTGNKKLNLTIAEKINEILLEKDLRLKFIIPDYESNDNDRSLIVQLCYKDRKFLFTGDISEKVEGQLVLANKDISSDVLKVSHHGSKYSTSDMFLDYINPKIAVISVGKNNLYGHPSSAVVDRLCKRHIDVLRTDQNGCISILSNGDYVKIKTMNGESKKL